MKGFLKIIFCVIYFSTILKIRVVDSIFDDEDELSQIKHCTDCKWSDEVECKVCFHEGHNSQFMVGLIRYDKNTDNPLSVIELAKENHEMFKNGQVSFVLRSEGPFGSLGFNKSFHGKDSNHVYKNQSKGSVKFRNRAVGSLVGGDSNQYIPLSQIKDSLYVGSMYVGTPPQLIHPIFDTGSTNVWVVGTKCESPSCKRVKRFNSSLSKTFKALTEPKRIHIKFGTGEIEGEPARDVVKIGGMSFEQNLAVVDEEKDKEGDRNVFEKIHFEGIVGLAFEEMSSIPGPSILDNVYNLGLLKHNEFAFYIGEEPTNALLMFGGANPEFYEGPLRMFPVVREHYWEVELDAIYLGEYKICCSEKSYVIFDSGTSLNSVPSSEFSSFVNLVKDKCGGRTADLTLTYVIGGQAIKLTPDQYIYSDEGHCVPAYMQLDVPSEFGHAYVLGSSAFMRFYFTLFKKGNGKTPSMVGIARAKKGVELDQFRNQLTL